jgi:hypothetical protein
MFEDFKPRRLLNLSINMIIVFLIRSYIVQKTYNIVWQKIVINTGEDINKFKPITFYESIMIVLLFSVLFRG